LEDVIKSVALGVGENRWQNGKSAFRQTDGGVSHWHDPSGYRVPSTIVDPRVRFPLFDVCGSFGDGPTHHARTRQAVLEVRLQLLILGKLLRW